MEESALLAAAASPHDLLRRQNTAVRRHREQATCIGDSHDHVQRSLERYVQDLVCQLEELSIAFPPRLRGTVSESTPDDLRAVLEERIRSMRQEIDQLSQPAAGSQSATAGGGFGSIPVYLQELHALKQQSRALQERKADLQLQLQRVREHQRAAASRQASLSSTDPVSAAAGRYNSLEISTMSSSVSSGSGEVSSFATTTNAGSSEYFSARTGSSEILRRTLEPQKIADFDSPRLESRARSLFSPTTEDVGKASGFSDSSAPGFGSDWGDDSSTAAVQQIGEGASWGAFASADEAAAVSTSSGFGDFTSASATPVAWSDDAASFGTFEQESEKRPESPSLLLFSPSGMSSAPQPEQATSRFFGDETFTSSAKSIMELYPTTTTGRQEAPAPAFDVFAFTEETTFSALDAGNEIDVNVQEALPVFDAVATAEASALSSVEPSKPARVASGKPGTTNLSASSLQNPDATSFDAFASSQSPGASSFGAFASSQSPDVPSFGAFAASPNDAIKEIAGSNVGEPAESIGEPMTGFEFAAFSDAADSSAKNEWEAGNSNFGGFGEWGAFQENAQVDSEAGFTGFSAFDAFTTTAPDGQDGTAPVDFGNFSFPTDPVQNDALNAPASFEAFGAFDDASLVSASAVAAADFGDFGFSSEPVGSGAVIGGDAEFAESAVAGLSSLSSLSASSVVVEASEEGETESASTITNTITTTTTTTSVEESAVSDGAASFGAFGAFEEASSSSSSSSAAGAGAGATAEEDASSVSASAVAAADFGDFGFSSEPVGSGAVIGGDAEFVEPTPGDSHVLGDDEFERMLDATPSGAVPDGSDFDFDAAIANSSNVSRVLSDSSDVHDHSSLHLSEEVDELLCGQVEDTPGKTYTLDEVDFEIEALFSPTSAQAEAGAST